MNKIKQAIIDSIETRFKVVKDEQLLRTIDYSGKMLISCLRGGNKILIAGNGGSAADAQHFAAELAGKFVHKNRKGLSAIALTTNSSITTAIGNDFGYEYVFSRQVEGLGKNGDIFVGISTSGNSNNLVLSCQMAKQLGIKTICLLGNDGGYIKPYCDLPIIVPSNNTQTIQECHIMIIHILCGIIDDYFA